MLASWILATVLVSVTTLQEDTAAPRVDPKTKTASDHNAGSNATSDKQRTTANTARSATKATKAAPAPSAHAPRSKPSSSHGLRDPFNDAKPRRATTVNASVGPTLTGELRNPFPNSAHKPTRPRSTRPTAAWSNANLDLQNPFSGDPPAPTGQTTPLPSGLKNPFVEVAPTAATRCAASTRVQRPQTGRPTSPQRCRPAKPRPSPRPAPPRPPPRKRGAASTP